MLAKFFHRNLYTKIIFKHFVNKDKKPIQKESLEPKTCYITDKIKFNEYGLYLVAEHLFRRPSYSDALNLTIMAYFSWLNIYACLGLLVFLNRDLVMSTFTLTEVIRYITHIYITKEMDKIVIKYYFPPVYRIYDIKDIKLLKPNQFNDFNHGYFAVVFIDGKIKYIPIDITIYNKELFSAIFNGDDIKQRNEEGKPNFVKLISNDKINYI
jgi:hypothetical protein